MRTVSRTQALVLALILLIPLSAAAQSDLRATIELAVRSDTNSAGLSDAQIQELVDALYADAVAQGMTAEDVVWRPLLSDERGAQMEECGFSCSAAQAFGLDGSNYVIPIMLGASSLMLIFILGAFLEYKHFRHLHPKHMTASKPPSSV